MREIVVSKAVLSKQYREMSINELMDYYGVCCDRMYKILDAAGIPRKRVRASHRAITKAIIVD